MRTLLRCVLALVCMHAFASATHAQSEVSIEGDLSSSTNMGELGKQRGVGLGGTLSVRSWDIQALVHVRQLSKIAEESGTRRLIAGGVRYWASDQFFIVLRGASLHLAVPLWDKDSAYLEGGGGICLLQGCRDRSARGRILLSTTYRREVLHARLFPNYTSGMSLHWQNDIAIHGGPVFIRTSTMVNESRYLQDGSPRRGGFASVSLALVWYPQR